MDTYDFPRLKKGFSKEKESEELQNADAVCLKYKKGDIFNFSLDRDGNIFRVILDGIKVGSFSVKSSDEGKQISFIMLNKNLQKKGFGKQLYIKLNEYFRENDKAVLMTDTNRTSEAADSLWKSLVRDGLAEEVNKETADKHKIYRFKI